MRPRPGRPIAATYPKAPLRLPSRLRAKQRARTGSRRLKAIFHLRRIYHGGEQKANRGGWLEAIIRLTAALCCPAGDGWVRSPNKVQRRAPHPAKSELSAILGRSVGLIV